MEVVFETGNFVLLFTKQGGLWLGMTGGLSTQVKMNVKPIGAFKSGLIRQVVFERRGLKIQGPLYKPLQLTTYKKKKIHSLFFCSSRGHFNPYSTSVPSLSKWQPLEVGERAVQRQRLFSLIL